MENSNIQWTDHTFNPWRGCVKVSAGCKNCYAETLSKRNPKVLGEWGPGSVRAIASESYWKLPAQWNRAAECNCGAAGSGMAECDWCAGGCKRRRVFCASLADVFEDRPDLTAPRARLLQTIHDTPNLDWQLLTKQPENFQRLIAEASMHGSRLEFPEIQDGAEMAGSWLQGRPPANVWLGVPAENQATADELIPHLLRTPAAVRFVNYEPALGPIDFRKGIYMMPGGARGTSLEWGLNWVTCGGESGPGARPCNIEWIRSAVRQCQSAGVAVFCKQLGSSNRCKHDAKGGCFDCFPNDLKIREFPK